MDFGNLFNSLWNMALGLIEVIGSVWQWLTTPLKIENDFLSVLLGGASNFNFKYSPLELLGTGIIFLLILWFTKHLVPSG